MCREIKRVIIICIYLAIFIGIVFLIYQKNRPKPSCFDNVKNQNETGVDCGGVCAKACPTVAQQNIEVQQAGFVPSGVNGSFDLYGIVTNPNQTLGSDSFDYQFTVKNSSGSVIAAKSGTDFILPGETKYIVEPNVPMQDTPAVAELTIGKAEWQEANEFYEAPQLKVVNKNYSEITNGVGFAEATGLLKNESSLAFATVKLEIILKDDQGNIVALNSTEMSTVQAGESRDFRVTWPQKFPGNVANMEVQAETNVFSSDAYVKQNFQPQKFQQY